MKCHFFFGAGSFTHFAVFYAVNALPFTGSAFGLLTAGAFWPASDFYF
jgi:hypothetical protein